jgi:hypothetical protein
MLKKGRKREAKGLAVLYFIIGLIILLIILAVIYFALAKLDYSDKLDPETTVRPYVEEYEPQPFVEEQSVEGSDSVPEYVMPEDEVDLTTGLEPLPEEYQEPVVEVLIQRETPNQVGGDRGVEERDSSPAPSYIAPLLEPSREALLEALVSKTRKLKLYAALLDSAAAEHAARTVAMQTATDNAENLLAELTLQYNKGRQQKITSEILDLAGGQAEN